MGREGQGHGEEGAGPWGGRGRAMGREGQGHGEGGAGPWGGVQAEAGWGPRGGEGLQPRTDRGRPEGEAESTRGGGCQARTDGERSPRVRVDRLHWDGSVRTGSHVA